MPYSVARRLLTTCLAIALASVACTTAPKPAADVSLLVAGDPAEIAAYRELIAAFAKSSPAFEVKLIPASDRDELLTRLSTSIAAGTPPDLFLVNYRFFAQYAVRGALAPIGDRLPASSALSEDQFFPEAIEAFRHDGVLNCLAQNVSSLVVYYNRDMFKAAGQPEPPASWTWDEMFATARAMTKDTDGDGTNDLHGLGVEPILARLAPFVWSNEGEIVDDVTAPTTLSLREPRAGYALLRFLDLGGGGEAAEGGPTPNLAVIPSDEQVEGEDLESRFMNGKLAMYMSSRRSTPTFRTIESFDWDVAPLPYHRRPSGVLHSDGYCMTAASKAKDEAWRFMEFALGAEGQRIMAASGRTVPSLREVAGSEAFLDPDERPARSQVFIDGIATLRAFPKISTWPEIEDAADVILEQGMYGGLSADDVITQLEEQTRDAFSRDGG
jgi:multiple sugar transport system substrate-binding protein